MCCVMVFYMSGQKSLKTYFIHYLLSIIHNCNSFIAHMNLPIIDICQQRLVPIHVLHFAHRSLQSLWEKGKAAPVSKGQGGRGSCRRWPRGSGASEFLTLGIIIDCELRERVCFVDARLPLHSRRVPMYQQSRVHKACHFPDFI